MSYTTPHHIPKYETLAKKKIVNYPFKTRVERLIRRTKNNDTQGFWAQICYRDPILLFRMWFGIRMANLVHLATAKYKKHLNTQKTVIGIGLVWLYHCWLWTNVLDDNEMLLKKIQKVLQTRKIQKFLFVWNISQCWRRWQPWPINHSP